MGISVSFATKSNFSETTHVSYSTMARLLELCGLEEGYEQVKEECYVDLPAKKVVRALELFVHEYQNGFSYVLTPEKFVDFARQILRQYNDFVKQGNKPRKFGGA
jgi:DNA-binding MurR/RpiR family transcriptional regulator